jgi:hypothetical protein
MEMDAFSVLSRYLNEIGLGSLFSVDSRGNPSGWLWDQITAGTDSEERLMMALEQTPEFRRRFQVIFDLREQAARGENVVVPNVSQVLQYEQQYKTVMSRAGVPSWFYDSYQDAHAAIARNLTVEQIAERIDSSFSVVTRLPQEVRDVFSEFFGDASDGALAAAVLDPEKTLANLEKATRMAVAGGYARRQGFDLTQGQASEYASLNRSLAQTEEQMAGVGMLRPLELSQAGEAETIQEGAVFEGVALGRADAMQAVESRLTTRRAGQSQIAGGALALQEGIVGAGVAR